MKLAGEEKRIQALFSELLLEDTFVVPRFDELWTRAGSATPERALPHRQSLVVVVTIILAIAAGTLLWLRNRPTESIVQNGGTILPAPILTAESLSKDESVSSAGVHRPRGKIHTRRLRSRSSERAVLSDAVVLSSWRSPTLILMDSPVTPVLQSLPQLNQAVKELEMFLPNNEVKEWNQ